MSARLRKKDMCRCVSVWNNKNLKKLLTNCLIHYLPTGLLYPDAKTLFSPSFSVAPVTSAFPPARRVALLGSLLFALHFRGGARRELARKKSKEKHCNFIYLSIHLFFLFLLLLLRRQRPPVLWRPRPPPVVSLC